MFAQASTAISDSPGFGAAEWIAILTGISLVLGSITTLIVVVLKLRTENRDQHDQNLRSSSERFDEVMSTVKDIDHKVEDVADNLQRHEFVHHKAKRRW
jgi:Tfp pilus assembly protein PilN